MISQQAMAMISKTANTQLNPPRIIGRNIEIFAKSSAFLVQKTQLGLIVIFNATIPKAAKKAIVANPVKNEQTNSSILVPPCLLWAQS